MAVSDTPHTDDPDEPTVRRPRLFGSGARDNDTTAPTPSAGGQENPGNPIGTSGGSTARSNSTGTGPQAGAPSQQTGTPGTPSTPGPQTGTLGSTPDPQASTPGSAPNPQTGTPGRPPDRQTGTPGQQTGPAETQTSEARQQRRRRRLTVVAISVGAAIVVIALCAGTLGVFSAVRGMRSDAADVRESRRLREADCLELETRLNRLIPPGATAAPAARATAIQDENAAVRIYLTRAHSQRDADAWRQLVDARTAYAESLQQQAKTRTPAFFVAPRTSDGRAVADQLARWSGAPCAGAIRRLAAPDL